MRVLVVGATGGSGRATVAELVRRSHEVTALVRQPGAAPGLAESVRIVQGDVTHPDDVDAAMKGQEAVVVTVGIRENPLLVRLLGSRATPITVRSVGTANVIDAMRRHGVGKLVVQSSFGVGDTRGRLPLKWRLIFGLLLAPQIEDTEVQEQRVRASGLRWVIAQPVALTDSDDAGVPFAALDGSVRAMSISRRSVATFLADAVERAAWDQRVVALS